MKKISICLQCVLILLCLSSCNESKGGDGLGYNYNTTNTQTKQSEKNLKSFSNTKELEDYSSHFWVYEEKAEMSNYKILFFHNKICYSWIFSYSSNETLSDCVKKVLTNGSSESLKNSTDFLLAGINVDGLKSENFEIQYDSENSQIKNSNGQSYGKFLSDGTFICSEEIYKIDEKLIELNKAFLAGKVGAFSKTYGNLATCNDVKYDPINYLSKKFVIIGTGELSDYYNYDYRDLEGYYFCICITPTGGGFTDRWYIYAPRDKYKDLFNKLKQGSLNLVLVCSSNYPDSLKHEMATLTDYCY